MDDGDDPLEPEELATDAIAELTSAVEELNTVLLLLEDGNGGEVVANSTQKHDRCESPSVSLQPNPICPKAGHLHVSLQFARLILLRPHALRLNPISV